jgi:hypothetical protein
MTEKNYRKRFSFFALLFSCFFSTFAQKGVTPLKGIRFDFGPAVGLYTINSKHARSPFTKINVLVGFKKEWRLDKENRQFFLTGIDYFFHGLGFNSYYFKPDTIPIYDKSFSYNYSLFIHELHLPLQFKYLFRRKGNKAFSSYVQLGYHLRYLVSSDLRITQNGSRVKYDSPELKFKTPLISNKLNPFVSLSYGWQKNTVGPEKGNFFVELNFKYGFSPYYFEKSYAPSSLYINSSHIALLMGIRL